MIWCGQGVRPNAAQPVGEEHLAEGVALGEIGDVDVALKIVPPEARSCLMKGPSILAYSRLTIRFAPYHLGGSLKNGTKGT